MIEKSKLDDLIIFLRNKKCSLIRGFFLQMKFEIFKEHREIIN